MIELPYLQNTMKSGEQSVLTLHSTREAEENPNKPYKNHINQSIIGEFIKTCKHGAFDFGKIENKLVTLAGHNR